jgi:phosphopantothenoylcysteine decarboxylase
MLNETPLARLSPATAVAAAQADGRKHLLLAASGSVAVIKLVSIIGALAPHPSLSIRVILTGSVSRFFTGSSDEQPSLDALQALPHVDGVYHDADEWEHPWTRGAPILHIELRRWADVLVIAPLSANTMAKITNGLCDNLLTSVVRAWDPSMGRIVVAPAMNSFMWMNPVTAKQIKMLGEEWGVAHGGWFEVLEPVIKTLACGDNGVGAMTQWTNIVARIEEILELGDKKLSKDTVP